MAWILPLEFLRACLPPRFQGVPKVEDLSPPSRSTRTSCACNSCGKLSHRLRIAAYEERTMQLTEYRGTYRDNRRRDVRQRTGTSFSHSRRNKASHGHFAYGTRRRSSDSNRHLAHSSQLHVKLQHKTEQLTSEHGDRSSSDSLIEYLTNCLNSILAKGGGLHPLLSFRHYVQGYEMNWIW